MQQTNTSAYNSIYKGNYIYIYIFFIHMSHEGGTKYKEGEGGFEHVTYRSQHLNLNH